MNSCHFDAQTGQKRRSEDPSDLEIRDKKASRILGDVISVIANMKCDSVCLYNSVLCTIN